MNKFQVFTALLREAYSMAERAQDYCFNNPDRGIVEDKVTALSYAAACTAKYSAATAMYWCSPELEDPDIPALLAQFGTFTDEIRDDYRNDHSRQWVSIEFDRLKELFQNSNYKMDHH